MGSNRKLKSVLGKRLGLLSKFIKNKSTSTQYEFQNNSGLNRLKKIT